MPRVDTARLRRPWAASDRPIPRVVVQPFQRFVHTEASGGVVLLAAAVVALVWANSPWSGSYESLWSTEAAVGIGSFVVREDLRHWVNDAAMALFFFVVGLEIKRELVHGDLRDRRAALLPVACAVGGMIVPVAIYLAATAGAAGARGWGIPMATDIAFSLGVLFLVGRRAPAPLKAFLLALAIVDDIGAIVVIAVFYSSGVSLAWLAGAAAGLVVVVVLQRWGVRSLVCYVVLAAAVWVMTFESGVHATLAGVALGLLTPAFAFQRPGIVRDAVRAELEAAPVGAEVVDERGEVMFLEVSSVAREAVSPLARMERALHPWSAMVVLPLFVLANAGVAFNGPPGGESLRVTLAVAAGLLVGKPVGVLAAAALVAVRLGRAPLPGGVGWVELAAVGMIAGIGFTVSLFVTGLVFTGALADAAKVGILGASVLAGLAGGLLLALRPADDPLVVRDDGH